MFIAAQLISLSGTWMQTVAQALLVLQLTGKGTDLGLVIACCQFLPMLFLAPVGGAVADRVDKRRLLCVTQAAAGVLALILGLLVVTHAVELWMVYGLAAGLGIVNSFDTPTRQTFLFEMVGPSEVTNAVSLNSVVVNLGRVIGPILAGVFVVTVGLATCFFYNAVSFGAVLIGLLLMRTDELHRTARSLTNTRIRDGIRYVRATPEILIPLLMLTVIGTLAWEFNVSLPLMAKFAFHGGAGTFSAMSAFMGVGAAAGGLVVATHNRSSLRVLALVSTAFGIAILFAAVAPNLPLELIAMMPMGAAGIAVIAVGSTLLQLASKPEMRGRVMSLWTVAFVGTTPIGGPIVGWMSDQVGPRWGLALGGISALLTGAIAYPLLAKPGGRATVVAPVPVAAIALAEELELRG